MMARRSRKPKTAILGKHPLIKNPLAQMFGTVLKELRAPRTSDEIADTIVIGRPAYRLIESGGATLLPAYSPSLHRTFPSLDWTRLLQFLVCSQAVSAVMPRDEDESLDVDALKAKANDVARLDTDLRVLISSLNPAFEAAREGAAAVEDVIAELGLTARVLTFLTSDPRMVRTASSVAEWVRAAPSHLPPLHLDMLVRQAQTLALFPLNVPSERLAIWERNTSERFHRIYALVQRLSSITGGDFNWEFLWQGRFEAAYIWILEEWHSSQMESFINELVARRTRSVKKVPASDVRNGLKRRLIIRHLSKSHEGALDPFLTYNPETGELHGGTPRQGEYRMRNAWFYRMLDTRVSIGFLSDFVKSGEKFISISLDSTQTLGFIRALEQLWVAELGTAFVPLYHEQEGR